MEQAFGNLAEQRWRNRYKAGMASVGTDWLLPRAGNKLHVVMMLSRCSVSGKTTIETIETIEAIALSPTSFLL